MKGTFIWFKCFIHSCCIVCCLTKDDKVLIVYLSMLVYFSKYNTIGEISIYFIIPSCYCLKVRLGDMLHRFDCFIEFALE